MNPMIPKMTKPAKTLVTQLPTATMTASLIMVSSLLILFKHYSIMEAGRQGIVVTKVRWSDKVTD